MHAVTLRTPEKPTAQRPHRDARSDAFGLRKVRAPVPSRITKRVCRHVSQECCPYNVKLAQELKEDAFSPREALDGKGARTLARELLAMSYEEFRVAFKGSPMKRAKLRGLKRNAAVVLGNVGSDEDIELFTRALDDPEPLVRDHAEWAIEQLSR